MYALELFGEAHPEPLSARTIDGGVLRIGRDESADWPIDDPSRTISRLHCEVSVDERGLLVRSLGANGLFDDRTRQRLPDGVAVRPALPFAFRIGALRIAITEVVGEAKTRPPQPAPPARPSHPVGFARTPSAATAAAPGALDRLLAAFCEGAGIAPETVAAADPIDIMMRAGAIYHQTVIGICDLTVERDRARASLDLGDGEAGGGIGGAIANPFEWTPTQRLKTDLLLARSPDFLPGPAAVAASFDDIRRHLVATDRAYARQR